ncbi:MAG: radical SAM protein [Candidatus Bathyarchaeales archaeon]
MQSDLPLKIRVSLGTAIVIGLMNGRLDAKPTTAYLMTYKRGKCTANCSFCPQARKSQSRADMLSRISWPAFQTEKAFKGLALAAAEGKIKRVCIQALNYPNVFSHLLALVKAAKQHANIPISISCQPLNIENLKRLAEAGVERVGIPIDAATERLFNKIKGAEAGGPYKWENQFKLLSEAVNIFGKGKVSTHLIVGLGETEEEMVKIIQECVDMGVLPALFAFTPIPGTLLEKNAQPQVQIYRRIQVARHLIVNGVARIENMSFDEEGKITDFGVEKDALWKIVRSGTPFLTSGCPNCNRPYYNEKPSGPIYNYPRKLTEKELNEVETQLELLEKPI